MLCILCPDVVRGPHPHLYVCMRDLELVNLSHACVSSVPPIFPFCCYRLILCQRVRRANSGGSRSPERMSKCVSNFSSTSGDLPSGL